MKRNFILGTMIALALVGGVLTYATANAAPQLANAEQLAVSANVDASQEGVFVSPNITVSEAPWQFDEVPYDVIPAEEAAQIGARYLWDVFGLDIDGKHVVMLYSDCWLRPGEGRWTGLIYNTIEDALATPWLYSEMAAVVAPVNPSVNPMDRMFNFTIDAATGERMEIASHSTTPPPAILHDTQPLWESAKGLRIQAMSDSELAAFIGLTPAQLDAYKQEITALAEAHFNNSTLQSVALGRNVIRPNGPMRLQGIQPLLDTRADGSIFGTLSGLEFTVTDNTGREAIVTISIHADSIRIW